jgi:ABC-2 type transport system ATP-binding protein
MIGLDPHAIKELKKLFVELKEQGCSLLISTHMIDSIEQLWDTTYIMKNGKIAAAVRKEDVETGSKKLEDIFFEITEAVAEDVTEDVIEDVAENVATEVTEDGKEV